LHHLILVLCPQACLKDRQVVHGVIAPADAYFFRRILKEGITAAS
jgi:hypothetical protein